MEVDWSEIEDAGPEYGITPDINEALERQLKQLLPLLTSFVEHGYLLSGSCNELQCSFVVYARQALQNIERLTEWYAEPIENVAWAVRNLFEIHLWMVYLKMAPDNIRRFDSYAALQHKKVRKAMRSMKLYMGADPVQTKTEGEIDAECDNLAAPFGLDVLTKKELEMFRNTRELAKVCNLELLYDSLQTIASVYLHPSPYSVGLSEGNADCYLLKAILAAICTDLLKMLKADFESIIFPE